MSGVEQGALHWVMALELPGRGMGSYHGTLTPAPGESRQDVYERIKQALEEQTPQLRGGSVVFFSLEPNELPAAPEAGGR